MISVRGGGDAVSGAAVFGRVSRWSMAEIEGLDVVVTGVTAWFRTSADLRLRRRGRRGRTSLVAGYDCADLEWMAHGLRGALGVLDDAAQRANAVKPVVR